MSKKQQYFPDHTYGETMACLGSTHIPLLTFLIKCNIAAAQNHLGWLYLTGLAVKKST